MEWLLYHNVPNLPGQSWTDLVERWVNSFVFFLATNEVPSQYDIEVEYVNANMNPQYRAENHV